MREIVLNGDTWNTCKHNERDMLGVTEKDKHDQNDQDSRVGSLRGFIQKFPDWVDKEIYAYKNKRLLRSNTKGYGEKTH